MSAPALVIFDCDGVLIDSEPIACRVDAQCFNAIGIPVTADEIMARYVGTSAATMFADIEARYGVTLPVDFPARLHEQLVAAFESELAPMPRVEDVLRGLTGKICVASSSTPERLRRSLSIARLLPFFDPHIFSATQVERGKPAPDLFLFVAHEMDVVPPHCVVIEDSEAGVRAAAAAGMRVIGFTGGGHCGSDHAARLREAGAGTIAATMDELPALLRA